MKLLTVFAIFLSSCTATNFEFSELKSQAVEQSGYDSGQPIQVEVGKWNGVAIRFFGLPVGVALVYLGKTVEQKIETTP